jgi:predicted lysophospholipase L1 biosynthesis ABC-type transport system permease subunit
MADKPQPGDWLTIIGIVSDIRQQNLTDKPSASIYLPYRQMMGQFFLSHMSFIIRTDGNPEALAGAVRAGIHKIDPELPTQSVTTMAAMLADTMIEPRSQTDLLGIFSVLAVFLAAVGVYGVLSNSVAERMQEIGIRMALGADQRQIVWMVLRRTLLLACSGVFAGALGAFAATRVLASSLFETSPTDPLTMIAVAAVLLLVALLASWIPAARASRVYPAVALRYE